MLQLLHEEFVREGAVVLRGFFKDWIDPLREAIAYNEAHPGPFFRDYTREPGQPRFFGDYCNWQNVPGYRDFILHGPAGTLAKALMGSQRARIFHEHVLVKEAGNDKVTPWHHDEPYYCVTAKQTVSIWLPLDPVARDSCVEFVAGSHRWGKLFRPSKFTQGSYDHRSDVLEPVPDIDAQRDQYSILGWALELGDAVAFDYRTVHGAPGNRSHSQSRRVISTRWLGDEAVYVDRGGETSPPYPELAKSLLPGQPLPESIFPYCA